MLTAAALDQAVELARAHAEIDLLLTDYRLAHGTTGIQTIDAVGACSGARWRRRIVTGDTSPETLHGIRARGLALLHKPMNEGQLRALVESVRRTTACCLGSTVSSGS